MKGKTIRAPADVNSPRLDYIDGLKGIVCILIFIFHFLLGFFPATYYGDKAVTHFSGNFDRFFTQFPLSVFISGNSSVFIFLMTSAFILSYLIFSDCENYDKLSVAVLKRYFRLCLPVFVVCLLVYFIMKMNLFTNMQAAAITKSTWLNDYYRTPLSLKSAFLDSFVEIWTKGSYRFSNAFWMLNILFWGSFIAMALSVMGRKANPGILLLYAGIAAVLYFEFSPYYASSALGAILAYCFVYLNDPLNRLKTARAVGWLLLLTGLFLCGYPTTVEKPVGIYAYLSCLPPYLSPPLFYHLIAAFLILSSLICSPPLQKIFSSKMFLYLGKISFAVYLLHIPVIYSFASSLFLAVFQSSHKYQTSVLIVFCATLVLTLLLSALFYKYVESACVKLVNGILRIFQRETAGKNQS